MKDITVLELLGIMFVQMAVNRQPNHSWVTLEKNIIHSAIFQLQKEYGTILPPLKELHFQIGGAFPYSAELARALDVLRASYFATLFKPSGACYHCHFLKEDSVEVLDNNLQTIFMDDPEAEKSFRECTKKLYELIACSPHPGM